MMTSKLGGLLVSSLFIFSFFLITFELIKNFDIFLLGVEIWILIEIALLIDYLISQ